MRCEDSNAKVPYRENKSIAVLFRKPGPDTFTGRAHKDRQINFSEQKKILYLI